LELAAAGDHDRGDSPEVGPSGIEISRYVISEAAAEQRTDLITPRVLPRLSDLEEVYRAWVLGLRDYLRKNGIGRVYLGLSGGIDSTLSAALACDAIGADNVYGISNPSDYSSEHSKTDAAELARRTGLHFDT